LLVIGRSCKECSYLVTARIPGGSSEESKKPVKQTENNGKKAKDGGENLVKMTPLMLGE